MLHLAFCLSIVASKASSMPASQPNEDLKKEQEQLSLENSVADARLRKELSKMKAERERRDVEVSLAQQKVQAETASMQAEIDRLSKQIELINKRQALKDVERKVRLDTELGAEREKLERAKIANDVSATALAAKRRELDQLTADLELREKRDLWKNRANTEPARLAEVFKNGVLTISDRRIALNGPIVPATAFYIEERVNYFNNQSREHPIFIVIDSSPGGSVEAGYHILKTMQGSAAPIYVVVKSFAASMAAGITTLAKRSFAYPNAIMLHHQMAGMSFGNMTVLREQMKEREEWWKRLAAPIAQKMGISLEDFVKRMYQQRSTGDWREFADVAKKLKWVDEVAEVIRETAIVKNPDAPPPQQHQPHPLRDTSEELVDQAGHHYVELPRLDPVDAYYLYSPDSYYREAR